MDSTALLAPLAVGVVIALYAWSVVWAYRDAEARGQRGLVATAFVALVPWPLGLAVWILVRPTATA